MKIDSEKLMKIINKAKQENGKLDVPLKYFKGEHDILKNRILMIDDKDNVIDSPYASNIRLSHPFFTQLVRQSTDFIFGEPIQFRTEEPLLMQLLKNYITSETHQLLYEAVEEASKKGYEWLYAFRDDETKLIDFMRVDSRQMTEVLDEFDRQQAVIRFTKEEATIWYRDGRMETYELVEGSKYDDNEYVLSEEAKHTVYDEKTGDVIAGFGRIPFFKLKNNREEESDLELIKPQLDDYDRMSSFASNDLQDFRSNVHILTGKGDENIGKVIQNMNATGGIGLNQKGDLKTESNNVNIQPRLDKMERLKADIFEIGQGFDASTITNASGNVTNESLVAGQKNLLNKTKGKKVYLNVLIEWILELILDDIENGGFGSFSVSDIEVIYTHDLIESGRDQAQIKQAEAEALKTRIDSILSVEHLIGADAALDLVSTLLEIEPDKVRENMELEDYGLELEGEHIDHEEHETD